MAVSASGASSAPLASFVKYVPEEVGKQQSNMSENKRRAARRGVYSPRPRAHLKASSMMLHIHVQKDDKQGYGNTAECVCVCVFNLGFFIDATVLTGNTLSDKQSDVFYLFFIRSAENFPLCSLLLFCVVLSSSGIDVWAFRPLTEIKMDDASTRVLLYGSPGDDCHLALIRSFVAGVTHDHLSRFVHTAVHSNVNGAQL